MSEDPAYDKAIEHWIWLERVMRLMYVEAFMHGYKHGKEGDKS